MTRLVFKEFGDSLITDNFLAGNMIVKVVLHPQLFEASIIDVEKYIPKATLGDENLTNLKKKIKKELIKMGVNFSAEVRPGRNVK